MSKVNLLGKKPCLPNALPISIFTSIGFCLLRSAAATGKAKPTDSSVVRIILFIMCLLLNMHLNDL